MNVVFHGDLQSLDPKPMRGAEPVMRICGTRCRQKVLLTVKTLAAKAVEPCQDRNIAALRHNFRVLTV